MSKSRATLTKYAAIAAVAVAALCAGVLATKATDESSASNGQAQMRQAPQNGQAPPGGQGPGSDQFAADLAKELGISTAKVKAALEAIQPEGVGTMQ